MPPVKRASTAPRNPLHRRLLALAELVAPPDQKPTLAYLERRAKLNRDALKESARRGSISKPVAAALIAAAPRLGISGLTADWLHYERGPEPHKGGETPQQVSEARAAYGAEAGEGEEDSAYLAYTLEALRALSTIEREQLGAGAQLELLEEVEKIGARFGQRAKDFIERQRERIRRGETLGGNSTS